MYSNNTTYRLKREMTDTGNIITAVLLLLFLGVTIKAWGISIETQLIWIVAFFALLLSSMFVFEIEIEDLKFFTIFLPLFIAMILEGLLVDILMMFSSCLILTIFIVKQRKEEINQAIENTVNLVKTLLGEMYGPIVVISTAVFILVFGILGEYFLAIFMFVVLLTETFTYLFVAMPKERQEALLNIKTILLLLVSLIAVSILALHYIGLLEIAMLLIIISSMGYCIYKAYILRND